jgi:hypothetical protein
VRRVARTIADTATVPPPVIGLADVVLALRMRSSLHPDGRMGRVA